jgi:predicted Zn finger-like uncharacterized protein
MKLVCPSCGEVFDDTTAEIVADGELVECDNCYEIFVLKLIEPIWEE